MKAIVLCAGYGKRLYPYTKKYQKTMIPLHGKPMLEYILNGLIYAGFQDIIFVVGYRKEQIIEYFQNGKKWGVSIEYVEQKDLNGTGGALLLCKDSISNNNFFLSWGDILVPYEVYKKVYDTHRKEKYDFILVANYTKDPHLGAAVFCDDVICKNIVEKPPKGTSGSNLNNCGVFIFSKEIFEVLKNLKPSERGEIEIPKALLIGMDQQNWKVRVVKMEKDRFRGDFGDKEEYERLKDDSSWLQFLKI